MRSSKRLWRHQIVQPLNSPLLTHGEKRRRKHLFSSLCSFLLKQIVYLIVSMYLCFFFVALPSYGLNFIQVTVIYCIKNVILFLFFGLPSSVAAQHLICHLDLTNALHKMSLENYCDHSHTHILRSSAPNYIFTRNTVSTRQVLDIDRNSVIDFSSEQHWQQSGKQA